MRFLDLGEWGLELLGVITLFLLNMISYFTPLVLTLNWFLFSQTDSSKHWQCICGAGNGYSSVILIVFLKRVNKCKLLSWFLCLFYAGFCVSYQVAMKYCKKYGSDKVRVLTLVKNRGKGGAVRMVIDAFISFSVWTTCAQICSS